MDRDTLSVGRRRDRGEPDARTADHAPAHLLSGHDHHRLWRNHPADHRALGAGHRRHLRLAGDPGHQHFRDRAPGTSAALLSLDRNAGARGHHRSARPQLGFRPRDDRDQGQRNRSRAKRRRYRSDQAACLHDRRQGLCGARGVPVRVFDPFHQPRQLFRNASDPADDHAYRRRHGLHRRLRHRRDGPGTILPEALRFLGQWYLVLYGLGVIAVIALAPGGLASLASQLQLRRAGAP